MNYPPKLNLLLWQLLLTGQQPMLSKVQPKVSRKNCKPLEEAGLLLIEKRGRANYLMPTAQTWVWAMENFAVKFPPQTHGAVQPLQCVLQTLGKHLQAQNLSLQDFLQAPAAETAQDLPQRIRQAAMQLGEGATQVRVRLTVLRECLPEVSRKDMDKALLEMHLAGQLVLMALDNPRSISAEDKQAAVMLAGAAKHILYLL